MALRRHHLSKTIDTLAADVRVSRQAPAVCQARLDAIRREIEHEVGEPEPGA